MQLGLANLANQRLIAHAHQMSPLARVALKPLTTRETPTVSIRGSTTLPTTAPNRTWSSRIIVVHLG